ncbi:uncharacterized protein BDW47DRAFT_106908 [Aspergillus candidus]|uniref:Uncharacterized protein n=1 Tax=Aspergillus candidus TaxID=41067 RepID=A0A2I2F9R2_ASPCN|nr:hypothetical protein BDW47DRAFT_106908 [Aspergillus candidus]PLB37374.1 hypothetical protein BDW47DRAFT_106908 [Aspergillus candidus]
MTYWKNARALQPTVNNSSRILSVTANCWMYVICTQARRTRSCNANPSSLSLPVFPTFCLPLLMLSLTAYHRSCQSYCRDDDPDPDPDSDDEGCRV